MLRVQRAARVLFPITFVAAVLLASWATPLKSPALRLTALCGGGYGYGYGAMPAVDGANPYNITTAGGTSVTLTGCGFTGATAVHFGATAATGFTVNSDTKITATSPIHIAAVVDVTVTTPLGTSPAQSGDQVDYAVPNSHCTSATVTPSTGTFGAGTQLMFSAQAQGCLGPRFAYWIQSPDQTWHFKQDFPSSTYTWDTSELNGLYHVHVWVNVTGSSFDAIAAGTVTITPCSSASVSPNTGTFPSGTQLAFTANASGCVGPRFAYWIQSPDLTWHFKQGFPNANYTWDTTELNGVYNIHVWANTGGNGFDAIGAGTVTITPCAAGTLTPSSTTVAHGSTINFTATSSGCVNPRYAYWVQYPDTTWHLVRTFGAGTFAWNTTGYVPGSYTVHVWINTGGNGFDAFDVGTVTLT